MKAIIKAIIAGSVIIGIGLVVLIVALALNGWKFMPQFDMTQYSSEEEISELRIYNSVGSVRTEFYDGDKVVVDYPVSDRYTMTVEEREGVLTVNGLNKNHWYNFTFLPSSLPQTIVKIPHGVVLKLAITVNAGKVDLAAGEYAESSVTVNAGGLSALGMTCPALKCEVNAGSVWIRSIESASFDCRVKAGSFSAERIGCPQIKVNVSAGSAGMTVSGKREEYTIFADKNAGSCNVANQTGTDPSKKIDIDVSAGSVNLSFV